MQAWNQQLFLLINSAGHPGSAMLMLARFIAADLMFLAVVALVWLWVRRRAARAALLATALGAAFGLLLNLLLGSLWFEPRPFMIGLGHRLLPHVADNSFPSDHATLMWSVGLGLLATGASRGWGLGVCLAGLAVAWARIYVGVHFPLDMVGSAVVAVIAAATARSISAPARRFLLPILDPVYEGVLDALHLPPGLFPRRAGRGP